LRKNFATLLEEELIKKIKHEAIEQGIRINDLIEKIFKEYFEKQK
jgi:predicted HicB family RNase H-like nuclease